MQKLDKSISKILSTKYMEWLNNPDVKHEGNNRYYYDDVAMNLFRCQSGVCAYTEMFICPAALYEEGNWTKGRYNLPEDAEYKRIEHLGELEHFDPENKKVQYWNWDNLFMIESKINSIKSDAEIVPYLKPDRSDYSPEKYFDYDDETHRFIPNTNITDPTKTAEIKNMIDNVLCLNHGTIKNYRENYINIIKDKKDRGIPYQIDQFFTAVKWTLG